jgi:hypothetical protein
MWENGGMDKTPLLRELRPHAIWDVIKEGVKLMIPFLAGLGIREWVHSHEVALMWTAALLVAAAIAFWDRMFKTRQRLQPEGTPIDASELVRLRAEVKDETSAKMDREGRYQELRRTYETDQGTWNKELGIKEEQIARLNARIAKLAPLGAAEDAQRGRAAQRTALEATAPRLNVKYLHSPGDNQKLIIGNDKDQAATHVIVGPLIVQDTHYTMTDPKPILQINGGDDETCGFALEDSKTKRRVFLPEILESGGRETINSVTLSYRDVDGKNQFSRRFILKLEVNGVVTWKPDGPTRLLP